MTKRNIAEMIDLFEIHGRGHALVSDDFGHWAVVSDGTQEVPENPPDDIALTFFATKEEWHPSIEAALAAFCSKIDG